MNYQEISEFVDNQHPITYSNTKTEVVFNDSKSLLGYFDGQTPENRLKNLWNFIIVPQDNNEKKITTIDGDKFKFIRLHDNLK